MPTISSVIAAASVRPWHCARLWTAVRDCGLVLHPEKTKVVYCKDTNRKGDHSIIHSTFSAIRFGRGGRSGGAAVRGVVSPGSQPQGAEGNPSGDPGLVTSRPGATRRWTTWPDVQSVHPRLDQLLQSLLQVGAVSDAASDRRSSSGGHVASSSACGMHRKVRGTGWHGWSDHRRICLLTGRFCMAKAEHWEPYEPRGSRTVVCPAKAGMFSRR